MFPKYDVIVVGAGHAGCEAAAAAATWVRSFAYHNEYADNRPNEL